MSTKLQAFMLLALALYFLILFQLLKKKRLNLRYTILWIFAGFLMLLVSLFPQILFAITDFVGIEVPSNALFALILFFIIIIMMTLTSIVSKQNEQLKRLTQTIALLEKRLREQESSTDYQQ